MEKKLAPIIVIVLLFVALLSTYAWFSDKTTTVGIFEISSGSPNRVVLGTGTDSITDYTVENLKIPFYQGQKGFKADGTAFTSDEADFLYAVDVNFPYKAQSEQSATFKLELDKAIIRVGGSFNLSVDNSLTLLGFNPTNFADDDYNKYLSTSVDSYPTGESASPTYIVCDNLTDKNIQAFVIDSSRVKEFFEFDYWKSAKTKIERKGTGYISAINSGVSLAYSTEVSEAGILNYIGLYIGFCGYNDTDKKYNKTFVFSDTNFQGSTYEFRLTAEIN